VLAATPEIVSSTASIAFCVEMSGGCVLSFAFLTTFKPRLRSELLEQELLVECTREITETSVAALPAVIPVTFELFVVNVTERLSARQPSAVPERPGSPFDLDDIDLLTGEIGSPFDLDDIDLLKFVRGDTITDFVGELEPDGVE
jgi:hypothetical protein